MSKAIVKVTIYNISLFVDTVEKQKILLGKRIKSFKYKLVLKTYAESSKFFKSKKFSGIFFLKETIGYVFELEFFL